MSSYSRKENLKRALMLAQKVVVRVIILKKNFESTRVAQRDLKLSKCPLGKCTCEKCPVLFGPRVFRACVNIVSIIDVAFNNVVAFVLPAIGVGRG